jgi:hypothetical protein
MAEKTLMRTFNTACTSSSDHLRDRMNHRWAMVVGMNFCRTDLDGHRSRVRSLIFEGSSRALQPRCQFPALSGSEWRLYTASTPPFSAKCHCKDSQAAASSLRKKCRKRPCLLPMSWGRGLEDGPVNVDWTPGHTSPQSRRRNMGSLELAVQKRRDAWAPLAECGVRVLKKCKFFRHAQRLSTLGPNVARSMARGY